jgi:hypothetical protein
LKIGVLSISHLSVDYIIFDLLLHSADHGSTGTYHAMKSRRVHLIANGPELHGTDADTEIVSALGEIGNIWPASVMDDAGIEENGKNEPCSSYFTV